MGLIKSFKIKSLMLLLQLLLMNIPLSAQEIPGFAPGYYMIQNKYRDSLIMLLELSPRIDSVIKLNSAPGKTESVLLENVCLYINKVGVDSATCSKARLILYDQVKQSYNTYELALSGTHKIPHQYVFFNLREHAELRSRALLSSAAIYTREEIDQIRDLRVKGSYKNKKKQLWLNLSFTAMVYTRDDFGNEKSETKKYMGWIKAEELSVVNCN
jgi:hypothetical protein